MTCEGDVYTLTIKGAKESDSGTYTVTAKSKAGETKFDVKVTVEPK